MRMTDQAPISEQQTILNQYRRNLPRFLIALSRHLQASSMNMLLEKKGHKTLKLSFEPYISMVGDGCRLTELADRLAISKQACNQTANQIEKAGYIRRASDPTDGRARMLVLTKQGHQLVADGTEVLSSITAEYIELIGEDQLLSITHSLGKLANALQLPLASYGTPSVEFKPLLLGALLPRMSDYVMKRLMELTIAKGHPGLKMSHGTILTLIGLNGGRIQQIAKQQAISKQAVSAIAKDLESLGYIRRHTDPEDSRQFILKLSAKGLELMADAVSSIDELNKQFEDILDDDKLAALEEGCHTLFNALNLEADFQRVSTEELPKLAQKLKQQLGEENAKHLAKLLLGES